MFKSPRTGRGTYTYYSHGTSREIQFGARGPIVACAHGAVTLASKPVTRRAEAGTERDWRHGPNGVDDHDGLVPKSPQGGKREENSQHARSTGSVPLPPSRTTAAAPPEPVTPNRHVVGEGSLVPEPSHTQPLPPPVSAAGMGLSDSRERLGS
ncbi:hypothetical protein CSUB01_07666 [Colletotrichum sublineola]|uniref:Uncharacterized protein n=1 Tax=Colletotrichum sublineola TaxID=1173701 RepID=A0A066XFS0_COLSU|nr:hypothetical protein CSUB01_07666 [Colletotrichum sublineola]